MNAKCFTSDRRAGRPAWRGLWPCIAALLCLGGCGLKRCATWERVTHPDYMREEQTTLHGFHRTSWDPWPEEFGYSPWARHKQDSTRSSAHPGERLPAGEPTPSLPAPQAHTGAPASRDESMASPGEAAQLSSLVEAASPTELAPTTAPVVADNAHWTDVTDMQPLELVAIVEPAVAEPLTANVAWELDASPSPYTERFAALIAANRKSQWRPLDTVSVVAEPPTSESTSRVIPVAEAPAYLKLQQITPERCEGDQCESPAQPMIKTPGDGAVQFRIASPNSGPILKVADESSTTGDDVTQAAGAE